MTPQALLTWIILHITLVSAYKTSSGSQSDWNSVLRRHHHHHHHRQQQTCDSKYTALTTQHTACLQPEKRPRKEGLTPEERLTIVTVHNYYRGNVERYGMPTAANMQRMVWDDELEMLAQKWASNCVYKHDEKPHRVIPGRFSVGQNIAWTMHRNWEWVLSLWHDEYRDFRYGYGSTTGRPVGHYTQMVWASSSKVGCGLAVCGRRHLYVCNYGPTGNLETHKDPTSIYKPFTAGSKGSMCPYVYDWRTGTCDCGGKVCYNGGVLNTTTCQCSCTKRPWIDHTHNCQLRCENAKDLFICGSVGGPWSRDRCLDAVNIPYDYCPVTCHWCPVEGNTYFGDVIQTTTTAPPPADDIPQSDGPLSRDPKSQSSGTSQGSTQRRNGPGQSNELAHSSSGSSAKSRRRFRSRMKKRGHNVGARGTSEKNVSEEEVQDNAQSSTIEEVELNHVSPIKSTQPVDTTGLARCTSVEPAACGQPSPSGYWPVTYCSHPAILARCPAMCQQCEAHTCIDYNHVEHAMGDQWIHNMVRLTCSPHGTTHESGCIKDELFIGHGESYAYVQDGYHWKCECLVEASSGRLHCTGTYVGDWLQRQ